MFKNQEERLTFLFAFPAVVVKLHYKLHLHTLRWYLVSLYEYHFLQVKWLWLLTLSSPSYMPTDRCFATISSFFKITEQASTLSCSSLFITAVCGVFPLIPDVKTSDGLQRQSTIIPWSTQDKIENSSSEIGEVEKLWKQGKLMTYCYA